MLNDESGSTVSNFNSIGSKNCPSGCLEIIHIQWFFVICLLTYPVLMILTANHSYCVNSNALLCINFRAHFWPTRIIESLAGNKWGQTQKHIKPVDQRWQWITYPNVLFEAITVVQAFPCWSIFEISQSNVNVEMDPTSPIEMINLRIEAGDMTIVVGWYHSHPAFIPISSLIDIQNLHDYQN